MDTSESSTEPQEKDPPGVIPARRGWRRWAMDTRPLRRPAYRRLWSSTIVTAVGSQLTAVAVPKQIYDITGSSAWVGAASLAGLLPLVVFALWGGAVADSMDRRKLLLITNSGIAVTSVLFWLQAVTGLASVAVLMVLLAVQQAFWGSTPRPAAPPSPVLCPPVNCPRRTPSARRSCRRARWSDRCWQACSYP